MAQEIFSRDMFGYNALVCAVKAKAMDCIKAIREAGGFIDATAQKIGKFLVLSSSLHRPGGLSD